ARIRELGMTAGLAINPDTPADRILPFLDAIDMALVMSVYPGFSGQKFIDSVLAKTRAIRDAGGARLRIEMDGGVAPESAVACRAHGADVLVAASAIFGKADYRAAIAAIRS
ncbi:MAG: ribulose-phosphate 3-epimerase, partial [bacterium]